MPITVENTMRKAEKSSAAKVGKVKKPIPKWFWGLLILVGGYTAYSYFKKDKGGHESLNIKNNYD